MAPIINETVWQLLPSPSQGPRQAGSKNIPVLGVCLAGEVSSGQSLKDKRHPKKGGIQGQFCFVPPGSFQASLPSLVTHSQYSLALLTWREGDIPASRLTLIPPTAEETLQVHGC